MCTSENAERNVCLNIILQSIYVNFNPVSNSQLAQNSKEGDGKVMVMLGKKRGCEHTAPSIARCADRLQHAVH